MRRSAAGIALIAGLLQTSSLGAQHANAHRILGVFDSESGLPLADVEVVDLFTDNAYRTQAAGLVGLWVFASRHDSVAVRVRKIGYADTAFVVMVAAADTAPVPLFLRKAVTLPDVITNALATKHGSPHLQQFYEHMNDKALSGTFLVGEALRKHDGQKLEELIRFLSDGRGCRPLVLIDGMKIPMIDGRHADDYEAVEFLKGGSVPIQYGTSRCGVILLWSREKV